MREGERILIFNGRDGEWLAELTNAGRRKADLSVLQQTRPQESGPDIDYCFAPLKHARLDYMVQKAVEMGARRLLPVMTKRTQVSRVNLSRMRANAIEAAEQCGILTIAEIANETALRRTSPSARLSACSSSATRKRMSPIPSPRCNRSGPNSVDPHRSVC